MIGGSLRLAGGTRPPARMLRGPESRPGDVILITGRTRGLAVFDPGVPGRVAPARPRVCSRHFSRGHATREPLQAAPSLTAAPDAVEGSRPGWGRGRRHAGSAVATRSRGRSGAARQLADQAPLLCARVGRTPSSPPSPSGARVSGPEAAWSRVGTGCPSNGGPLPQNTGRRTAHEGPAPARAQPALRPPCPPCPPCPLCPCPGSSCCGSAP